MAQSAEVRRIYVQMKSLYHIAGRHEFERAAPMPVHSKMPVCEIARVALLSAFLLACSPSKTPAPVAGQPRVLDARPVKTNLQSPLPEGKAEALFRMDTGGDQMTQTSRQAGLVVVVRVGNDEYRQTIATCPDPGLGSALGGGTERELEVAICNGEYVLVSEPGLVSVLPVEDEVEGNAVARFELPRDVRAVRPRDTIAIPRPRP